MVEGQTSNSNDTTKRVPDEKIASAIQSNQNMEVTVWQPGDRLNNSRYIIKEKLGAGGFGVAYLARDTELNRDVVIKTLNDQVQSKPYFHKILLDFTKEAQRLSKCKHSYIVTIYDIFHETMHCEQIPCIVMEHISGKTLKSQLDDLGKMEEEDALHYIRQIGKALDVVHQNGLVHRDVKPGNIMIRGEDKLEAILIDFGIAREFASDKVILQTAYVSEDYAPLEQYDVSERKGPYTDVFALAGTLYIMLTGTNPETARKRSDKINMHQGDPLKPPKEHNEKISDLVNQAIIKGLDLSPNKRPQSIQAWLDLLTTENKPIGGPLSDDLIKNPPLEPKPNTDYISPLITAAVSWLLANCLLSVLKPWYLSIALWLLVLVVVALLVRLFRSSYQLMYWLTITVSPTLAILTVRLFFGQPLDKINQLMAVLLTGVAALIGAAIDYVDQRQEA
jgi:serine/threonine protein kinase